HRLRYRRRKAQWGRDSIPGIDLAHGHREKADFAIREVRPKRVERFIVDVTLSHQRHAFGPVQRRAFARRENPGIAPSDEQIQLGSWNVQLPRVVEMELDAEGASIQLRCANLDEFAKVRLNA